MSKPIYCKGCHSRGTWVRVPERDIRSTDGKVLWERYACKVCGNETIVPVDDMLPTPVSRSA